MAGYDLATARAHLDQWIKADLAVGKRQRYSIDGRSLDSTDAELILERINFWRTEVERLERGQTTVRRARYAVPL